MSSPASTFQGLLEAGWLRKPLSFLFLLAEGVAVGEGLLSFFQRDTPSGGVGIVVLGCMYSRQGVATPALAGS